MKPKTLLILFALLAVLAGLYLLVPGTTVGTGAGNRKWKPGKRLFPNYAKTRAREIVLSKGGVTVRLKKTGPEIWSVLHGGETSGQPRRVLREPMDELLKTLADAAPVESRKAELSTFGLDDAHKTTLEVTGEDGSVIAKAEIGVAPSYDKCFARVPEYDDVLEIDQNLEAASLHTTRGEARVLDETVWYDLQVLRFEQEDVKEIVIERPGKKGPERIRLEKTEPPPPPEPAPAPAPPGEAEKKTEPPVWKIVEPAADAGEADFGSVTRVFVTAAHLYSSGYADDVPEAERGLAEPHAKLTVKLADGTTYRLLFGKAVPSKTDKDDGFAVTQVEGHPEIWKIAYYNYASMTLGADDLRKKATTEAATPKNDGAKTEQPKKTEKTEKTAAPPKVELPDPPPPEKVYRLPERGAK
ncbi:MAG: DUF4340 domain-containing protein [Planctomycetes bacterium]|nr:DUF4340 domain-containing protein [Planctomycetota bacterium]